MSDEQLTEHCIGCTDAASAHFKNILPSSVLISSDLWIVPPKDFTFNDTGIDVTAGYEGGPVHGTIGFASVELGGYRVDNQAFINATSVQLREVLELGLDGLVGFAFDGTDASDIIDTLKAKGSDPILGDPFLYNVFKQTPDQNNFIGISLSRTGDLEGSADASFTINAVDIAYREVLNAPALPLFPGDNQAWSIVIDGISVDGVDVTLPSSVHTDLSAGKLSVLMDTGNPDTELPTAVLHDIYSKIPGARYRLKEAGVGWTWSIPCNTTSIVTIEIGGQPFPIHPLDLSDPVAAPFSNGGTTCFSPMTEVDVTAGSHFDGSFGDTILRNMYAVYNFGDTISKSPTGNASMQLLSQTDPIAAAADVLKVRMPKLATSASAGSGAVAVAADAADSNLGGAGVDAANVKKYAITIIGLLGAHLVVMLVLTVVGIILCVKRGGKSARKGPKYSRVMSPTEVDGRPWDSESYDDKQKKTIMDGSLEETGSRLG
ncbi:aspartic peptidase domain-containing protein [Mycena crocata]|nr:aspartic peptidase domain-containing protein [Mycena crocata]